MGAIELFVRRRGNGMGAKMICQAITILIYVSLCVLLAGCITAVDESLPHEQLPEITVATPFNLVASPSHPTAYLSADQIPAGEKVQVIGTDKNAAWLLVLHDNRLGWMPTFYSRSNIGKLKPSVVIEPLSSKCTRYLAATNTFAEAWISPASNSVIVLGSIYRSQPGEQFAEAALTLEIDGNGQATGADYVHLPLTASSAVILFAFAVDNLQKDSRINFALTGPSQEPLSFQAAFFSNDCRDNLDTIGSGFVNPLPIGETKMTIAQPVPRPTTAVAPPTEQAAPSTPTPIIIPKKSSTSALVAADGGKLNVRKGPGTNYPIQTQIADGAQVTILGRLNDSRWLNIRTESGVEGWVNAAYILPDRPVTEYPIVPAPPPPVIASTNVYYRTSVSIICNDPTGQVWFDGMVTANGQPVNGVRIVFKSRLVPGDQPATQPATTGPQRVFPNWANGYYWHIVDSDEAQAKPKHLHIWVINDAGKRISDYANWDTDGQNGTCNKATVNFFTP